MAELGAIVRIGTLSFCLAVNMVPDRTVAAEHETIIQCQSDTLLINSGFSFFWTQFRQGIASGKPHIVRKFVHFPLKVSGATDSDPKREIDELSFSSFLESYLNQDAGQQQKVVSIRSYVEKSVCLDASALGDRGQSAQVGPLIFIRADGEWRLVEVISYGE